MAAPSTTPSSHPDGATPISGWLALKSAGNSAYSAGSMHDAIDLYGRALLDESIPTADRALVLSNRAQCFLRLGDNNAAVADCTACLTIQPQNQKALFRRYVCDG